MENKEEISVAMKLAEDVKAIRDGMQLMIDSGIDMEMLILLIDSKIPRKAQVGKNRVREVLEAQKKVLKELGQLAR